MKNRKRSAQALAILGAVAMLVSAAFHGTLGYQGMVGGLAGKGVDPIIFAALKAIWLIVSWHWIAIAILVLASSFGRTAPWKVILSVCGIAVIGDALGAFAAIGAFVGDELLAIAGVSILAAAALFPPPLANH
jgi:hypothetical protein